MANYQSVSKGKKRKVGAVSMRTVTVPERPVDIGHRRSTVLQLKLINSMDLDEMLEASKVIEMGIKGEKIPVVKSLKAQKYAGTILQLNRRRNTKPMAEKMMHALNTRIIKENKRTTDAIESRRLYHELMAEE